MSVRAGLGLVVSTAGVLICAAGCSAGGTNPASGAASSLSDISPEQSEVVARGTATNEEYQASFERFVACAAEAGFTISSTGISYGVIDYQMTTDASESPEVQSCYAFEFEQVDQMWQVQNEDRSETAEMLKACLSAEGLQVPEHLAERRQAVEEAGLSFDYCADKYVPQGG